MPIDLIINTSDFSGYVDLSVNTNNEQHILNYIRRAQMEERKYWTNDELLNALLNDKNASRFQTLIYGDQSYTDTLGEDHIFEGLAPMLSYWTAAKLVKSGYFVHTINGYSIGREENKRELSKDEKKRFYWEFRNKAEYYEKETIEYLHSNLSTYPEWQQEYICRPGVLGNYR